MSQSQHAHSRVIRNVISLLVTQLGTWTITLALTFVLPPYLGVQTYGLYAFAVTYTGFFALGISLGTGTYLTWRIAREPHQASRLTLNTLALQIPLGLFWSVAGLLIFSLMDDRPLAMELAAVMMIGTCLSALVSTCIAALGGLQIMRTPSFLMVGTSALGAALIIATVELRLNVLIIAVVGLGAQIVSVLVILVYTHHKISLHAPLDLRLWPKLIAGGLPFLAWSVVLLFYWQIDVIQLKAMVGDTVVGWYAAANRIIGIPVFLPNIVVTAILPALSRERTADSPAFRAIASRAIRLVILVNVPACVGTIMLANSMVSFLHYPSAFDQIAPLIIILAFNMPLVALDMVLGTILISLGRQRAWTVVGIIAGIANPLVNLWAIPLTQHLYGDGAIGASFTTIQSELIMFVGALILRPKSVFNGWDVWYVFRCLLAAGIMIPAVWGLSTRTGVGMFPAVGYGVLVYALAAYALQVVRNSDFTALVAAVGARAGIGDTSQLDWSTLRARLGIGSRVARTRAALGRVQWAISRPLGAVSRPLARAGGVVSQPLASAGQNVTSVLRSQYHASPVSQYIQKAGELFRQEEIPDGAMEPAREAATSDVVEASIPTPDGGVTPQYIGQALAPESFAVSPVSPVSPLPRAASESANGWSDGGASEREGQRQAPRPTARKDPRTMKRGETEPLPSLEEVQRLSTAPSIRPSLSAGPMRD